MIADYITASANFPSGYGSLGVTGGDGRVNAGSATNVVGVTTSLARNLNQSPAFHGFIVNSPAPEANFPTWDYLNSYTIVVRASAFGASGFGGVAVPSVHNSPSKLGFNEVLPKPCEACVTNLATVTARANNLTVSASDTASVCVNPGVAPASPVLRMGLVNGRLALSWPDSAEGFILESATTAKGVWTPVNATPTVVTGRKVVTVPAAGQRFFRLRKP